MFEGETLCDLFARTAAQGGDRVALSGPGEELTWAEYAGRVRTLATRWSTVGVRARQPVAVMLGNSPVFHVVDTSLMHAGAVPFSVADTDPVDRLVLLLDISRAAVLVTSAATAGHARTVAAACLRPPAVVVVDGVVEGTTSLSDVETAPDDGTDFESLRRRVDPEDDATLIFTSGTTGAPKAVRLSHRAIALSLRNTHAVAPVSGMGSVLSYLPLSHIAERFMSHYTSIGFGVAVVSVPAADSLYDEIARVRPSRFFGVPRVFEKIADRVTRALAADPELRAAADLGLRCVRAEQTGVVPAEEDVHGRPAALELLAPVRAALGLDRTEYRGVATAPSSPAVLELMSAIGLPVGNIWGMSEAIMCTMNPPERLRLATVGVFLDGVQATVADDGELLVRGVNLFSGYLHDEVLTRAALDDEGWLHTGDLGRIDDAGYLSIVGRKKDIAITATGKNIAPAAVEGALTGASVLIDHAMAVADGRRYVTAVLALDEEQVLAFAHSHGLSGGFAELARSEEVSDELARAVAQANRSLQRAETVRGWYVAPEPWRPGGPVLTSTMKLRRDQVADAYAQEIDRLYRG